MCVLFILLTTCTTCDNHRNFVRNVLSFGLCNNTSSNTSTLNTPVLKDNSNNCWIHIANYTVKAKYSQCTQKGSILSLSMGGHTCNKLVTCKYARLLLYMNQSAYSFNHLWICWMTLLILTSRYDISFTKYKTCHICC